MGVCRRCKRDFPASAFVPIKRTRSSNCVECRSEIRANRVSRLPRVNPDDPSGGTAIVPLTQGKTAVIDAADWPLVGEYVLHYHGTRDERGYAARQIGGRRHPTTLYLHRVIACAPPSAHVDHVNGDTLDDRRRNLRCGGAAENLRNARKQSGNRSGFKGVYWHAQRRKWCAQIRADGYPRYIGLFDTAEAAARAYDAVARRVWGDWARLNFPDT